MGVLCNKITPMWAHGGIFNCRVATRYYLLCGGWVAAKIALITMAAAMHKPATNNGLPKVNIVGVGIGSMFLPLGVGRYAPPPIFCCLLGWRFTVIASGNGS